MACRYLICGTLAVASTSTGARADANATWAAMASAAVTTTATYQTGDTSLSWSAPNGQSVQLVVKAPHPAGSQTWTMPAVAAGADATPAFASAFASAKASGAAVISIPNATYTFKTLDKSKLGHLVLSGLRDVTVEFNGSTLVFMNNAVGIYVTQSQRVDVKSVHISYGFNTVSLGTMVNRGGGNELVITQSKYPITGADGIGHIAEYDPAAKNFVHDGVRIYQPSSPTLLGDGGYASPSFTSKMVGRTFAVFHHYYGGNAVELEDSWLSGTAQDKDITLDNVNVQSGPGMGIVPYGVKRGLVIVNSSIEPQSGSLFSTEYDGIHLQQVGGDVYIVANTISGQGDDAINADSPVSPVVSLDGSGTNLTLGVYSRFIQPGDTIAFFNAADKYLASAVVSSMTTVGYPNSTMVLASAVTGVAAGNVARDVNLTNNRMYIGHNVISGCQCHALLLQTPNAEVKDNVISQTADGGIEVLSNIGSFQEGTGAINDVIEGNMLSDTGYDPSLSMPWGAISLYGATGAGLEANAINYWVSVLDNVVQDADHEGCITVASTSYASVVGNSCTDTNLGQAAGTPSVYVLNAENVNLSGNATSGSSTGPVYVAPSTTGVTQ